MSPQSVVVTGWPNRQNTTSASISFRIFVAYQWPDVCPSGQLYDNSTKKCVTCTSPCSTCISTGPKASPTACTWCIANYTYIESNNSCVVQTSTVLNCPIGTLLDPVLQMCRACPMYCATCSDTSTCTSCVPTYNLANGTCNPNLVCPSGYRFDTGLGCQPCPSNC